MIKFHGHDCEGTIHAANAARVAFNILFPGPTPYQVDLMRFQQWQHVNDVLEHPLEDSYQAKVILDFKWADWTDPGKTMTNKFRRVDTDYKNFPNRLKPIEGPAP